MNYYIKNWFFLFFFLLLFGCKEKVVIVPDSMVFVAEGKFKMGSNDFKENPDEGEYKMKLPLYADEFPEHMVFLSDFVIDKFEVTNQKYHLFKNDHKYPPGKNNHPVVNVNWFEAKEYCESLGKRLPTPAEWEKAARGTKGFIYPWGDVYAVKNANTGRSNIKDTTPVGINEKGVSPYGVYDMIGNASEWTSDWYKGYPGTELKSSDYGTIFRELKGSSWGGVGHYKLGAFDRSSFRRKAKPGKNVPDAGIRCAQSV